MNSPYYISNVTNELHKSDCYWKSTKFTICLGFFDSPSIAMKFAIRNGYPDVKICKFCCTS